jgi:hypothetical protein
MSSLRLDALLALVADPAVGAQATGVRKVLENANDQVCSTCRIVTCGLGVSSKVAAYWPSGGALVVSICCQPVCS